MNNKEDCAIDEEAHIYDFYKKPKIIMEPLVQISCSRYIFNSLYCNIKIK